MGSACGGTSYAKWQSLNKGDYHGTVIKFPPGSDLVLRMLEAGKEQLGVRLNAGTQVTTQGQQFKMQEASNP